MDRIARPAFGLVLAAFIAPVVGAASSAAPHWLSFPADAPLHARLTLLPRQGEVGRDNPVFQGYAPELVFGPGSHGASCRLDLGGNDAQLAPGETRTVGLDCFEALKVRDDELTFTALEGGRKVGEGVLLR